MKVERHPQRDATREEPSRLTLAAFTASLRRRLEKASTQTSLPTDIEQHVRQIEQTADLADRFTKAATSAGCVVSTAGPDDWVSAVREALHEIAARSVVVQPVEESALDAKRAAELASRLAQEGVAVERAAADFSPRGAAQADADTAVETLFAADAAVTGVTAAIAETGTIVCESGPGITRGSSLIPAAHIALLHVSQIVPDVFDIFAELSRRGTLPANVNLITGPSKTADIEGILVRGVHGPGRVHIVLITGQPA